MQINYYVKHNVNFINNIAKCTKLLFIILPYIHTCIDTIYSTYTYIHIKHYAVYQSKITVL